MTWRRWVSGLIGAAINSSAGSVAVVIVDPTDFDPFHGGLMKLAKVAFVLAIVGAAMWLKEHKIPGADV